MKRIDRENHEIVGDDLDQHHVEAQAQFFPHTIPIRKHRTNNAANSSCCTNVKEVQTIARPVVLYLLAGGKDTAPVGE